MAELAQVVTLAEAVERFLEGTGGSRAVARVEVVQVAQREVLEAGKAAVEMVAATVEVVTAAVVRVAVTVAEGREERMGASVETVEEVTAAGSVGGMVVERRIRIHPHPIEERCTRTGSSRWYLYTWRGRYGRRQCPRRIHRCQCTRARLKIAMPWQGRWRKCRCESRAYRRRCSRL